MKKFFSIAGIILFFITISCSQTTEKSSLKNNEASIKFESTTHDFGNIAYNGNGVYEFTFKNTGKEALILKNVRPGCGCTVTEWPKDPIKKGEQGVIKVKYNTRITGSFTKSISVFSNATNEPIILTIKGRVEEAAAAADKNTAEN